MLAWAEIHKDGLLANWTLTMNSELPFKIEPLKNYLLLLTFENNEKRIFDMSPLLDKGVFCQLQDVDLFNTVKVSFDTISWDNEADLCPEVLYKQSQPYMNS